MVKDIQEQFKYTYWNKESELQSGISRKDAVGFSDVDIFVAQLAGESQAALALHDAGLHGQHFATGRGQLADPRYRVVW